MPGAGQVGAEGHLGTAEPGQTRIVVADDDPDILHLVVCKLTQAGFDAVGATDITMPGMSGIDVLRKVRANEAINDLDVILLSGRARDADVDTGSATGASDCVTEPFSPRELLHRVNAVLTRGVR